MEIKTKHICFVNIIPVPKPRMTISDKWKQRPCVLKYREYADKIRSQVPEMVAKRLVLDFYVPMPKSWSKKKCNEFNGSPHERTPDIDNLVKAFLDSLYSDDCHVYQIFATKYWVEEGKEGVNVAEIVD